MTTLTELRTRHNPTWCPGCDDFLIMAGLQQALVARSIPTAQTVVVYDIGCIGNMADFMHSYAVHSLHGRSIAVAMGIKIFRPDLTVIAIGGDGGIYGEGLNHLVSAARSNVDVKVIVANNHLYSLTTGQTSPTTPQGSKTKSTPFGVSSSALDPVLLLKSLKPDIWVEHVVARQVPLLNQKINELLQAPGFGLLDVDQVCVTFGKQLR